MQVQLNPIKTIEVALQEVASTTAGFDIKFCPGVRLADPKFGDYQANGVLGYAKITQENPRKLAQSLIDSANNSEQFDSDMVNLSLAGPGFINFKLTAKFYWQWLQKFATPSDFQLGAGSYKEGSPYSN